MARKVNPMLAKIEARHRIDLEFQRSFTIQQCQDMMLIAASEAFGFGADRLVRLQAAYQQVFEDYANMAIEDGRADPDIEYTRAKVDRKLEQILGEHFVPWDERYRL